MSTLFYACMCGSWLQRSWLEACMVVKICRFQAHDCVMDAVRMPLCLCVCIRVWQAWCLYNVLLMYPSDPVGHSALSGCDIVTFWESARLINPLNLAALFPLSIRMKNASVHFPGLNRAGGLAREAAWNNCKKGKEQERRVGRAEGRVKEKRIVMKPIIHILLKFCCFGLVTKDLLECHSVLLASHFPLTLKAQMWAF